MNYSPEVCYKAVQSRDRRFDGRFFTGVTSTGIFCRPVCPAKTPQLSNCLFLPTAAAAIAQGFRPCLRCRPEAAPNSPAWRGVQTTVGRALRLIEQGALNEGNIEELATRLGIGTRHLRRLFNQHLGVSPQIVAQSQRILLAKKLIIETQFAMQEVAFHAGFNSVRRFNDVFKKLYGKAPNELRPSTKKLLSTPSPNFSLKLPYRLPYDWPQVSQFLSTRAIPGVEEAGSWGYRRSIRVGKTEGVLEVLHQEGNPSFILKLIMENITQLPAMVMKARQLLDLDADSEKINKHLSSDPLLADLVKNKPGLRVPGSWDVFELSIRAILGQQISVAAARTFAGRLVERFGEPLVNPVGEVTHLFPHPSRLMHEDVSVIGLPKRRAASITKLADVFVNSPLPFEAAESLDELQTMLCSLPGIGPWTAQYIAMRGLSEPDAMPDADLGLLRVLQQHIEGADAKLLMQRAEQWRPWRAYAAMHLWMSE